jgi:hypothetical protein
VARGFNTSYGFLQGGEDHYTHWCGASAADCDIPGAPSSWTKAGAWDLWSQSNDDFPGHPVLGINGTVGDDATYSGYIFTKRVVAIVHGHGEAMAKAARGGGGDDNSDGNTAAAAAVGAAEAAAAAAAAPLFVYWALHNTHAPIEAPERFVAQYAHFNDPKKETFSAMVR